MKDEPLLNVDEVAAHLRVSRRFVYGLIRSGQLKARELGVRVVIRVEPKALYEFLRARDKQSKFTPQRSQPSRPVLVRGDLALGGDRFR